MAPADLGGAGEERQESSPSQGSLGIDVGHTGAPGVPLLRRGGVRTIHKAILNRVWPLGRQKPRPPPSDGFWLDDDQVVTCASVLLFGVLTEEAAAAVWVTHHTYLATDLQLLGQGEEVSEELQELRLWLRQTPHLVAYVVTQVWGAHWVCLAVDAASADRPVEVAVYDSKQEVCTADVRDSAHTAARAVFEMKYPDREFPGAAPYVMHVPLEDRQDPRHADCGFHVALFIAEDATRRRQSEADRRGRREAQLAPLHNCARSARLLRRWMQTHADLFFRPHSSSAGSALDRERCRAAFKELQHWAPGSGGAALAGEDLVFGPEDQVDDRLCECRPSVTCVAVPVAVAALLLLILFFALHGRR